MDVDRIAHQKERVEEGMVNLAKLNGLTPARLCAIEEHLVAKLHVVCFSHVPGDDLINICHKVIHLVPGFNEESTLDPTKQTQTLVFTRAVDASTIHYSQLAE